MTVNLILGGHRCGSIVDVGDFTRTEALNCPEMFTRYDRNVSKADSGCIFTLAHVFPALLRDEAADSPNELID